MKSISTLLDKQNEVLNCSLSMQWVLLSILLKYVHICVPICPRTKSRYPHPHVSDGKKKKKKDIQDSFLEVQNHVKEKQIILPN